MKMRKENRENKRVKEKNKKLHVAADMDCRESTKLDIVVSFVVLSLSYDLVF